MYPLMVKKRHTKSLKRTEKHIENVLSKSILENTLKYFKYAGENSEPRIFYLT